MEAEAVGSKRILECFDEAKSPQRILVRSLLKSRNKLRAKYRELRSECKRWRNQAAAVEKSRTVWRHRALTGEGALRDEQAERAALEAQLQELREQSAAREAELAALRTQPTVPEGAEKKGR
jgi:chromosome segregation ATPase